VPKVLKVQMELQALKGPQDWNQMSLVDRVLKEFKEYKVT
jgi:hypothetical protein